jgi:hypothetical protein
MDFAYGETVTVVPGSIGSDNNGDPIPDTRVEHDLERCGVAFRYSTEPTERGRQGVIVGVTVLAPPRSDVLSTDELRVRGGLYKVEGEPADWRSPYTGWEPGMEISAKKAVG